MDTLAELDWTEAYGFVPPVPPAVNDQPAEAGDPTPLVDLETQQPTTPPIPLSKQVDEVRRVLQTSADRSLVVAIIEHWKAFVSKRDETETLCRQLMTQYNIQLHRDYGTAQRVGRLIKAATTRRDWKSRRALVSKSTEYHQLREQLGAGLAAAQLRIAELRQQFAQAAESPVWRQVKLDGKTRGIILACARDGYIIDRSLETLTEFDQAEKLWYDEANKHKPKPHKVKNPGSAARRHRKLYPDGKPKSEPKDKKQKNKKGK